MACPTFLIGHHQDAALAIPMATMPVPVQGLMSDGRWVRVVFLWGQTLFCYQVREREGPLVEERQGPPVEEREGSGSIVARMQK
jgi:hypothetical protein